jgi:hypothetical protein
MIEVLYSALLGGTAEFQGKAKIKFESETREYLPTHQSRVWNGR